MKIIMVDNFDRELHADRLIAENVDETWGKRIVEWLNSRYSGDYAPDYFKLVANETKLAEGFRP